MRLILFVVFIGVLTTTDLGSESTSNSVKTLNLTSKIFNNTRTLRILLPAEYELPANSSKRYPVIYFNDGYAVFHYWNLENTIRELTTKKLLQPLIVVGIDNAGEEERAMEYLPYEDESNPDVVNPKGKKYPEFLVTEVIPLVEKNFRTKPEPENRALAGASYGAYMALYTVIQKPGVFGKLLLESTPVFISDFQIFRDAKSAENWPSRISIGVGTKETDDDEINSTIGPNVKELESIILSGSPSTDIKVVLQENASHNSKAWGSRLPDALQFLFATQP